MSSGRHMSIVLCRNKATIQSGNQEYKDEALQQFIANSKMQTSFTLKKPAVPAGSPV